MTSQLTTREFVDTGGWWLARLLLAAASCLALLSPGGQLVLAPILLPLQWGAARASGPSGRAGFTILAALLLLEVGVLLGGVALSAVWAGDSTVGSIAGLAAGAAAAYWFYRSVRR